MRHSALSYTLWMDLKQTEYIVNCKMHLIAKSILEGEARRLYFNVLENFCNSKSHKKSQGKSVENIFFKGKERAKYYWL